MAKLKNIIKQLSEKDFKAIYDSLIESNAEKSAYLLRSLRERQLSDNKIMTELDVNANAYYTLRSRLNLKIEEYLMGQLESPRTDVLRKVANINEVLFTKKKAISVATLKKLEKELLDYDLANELTVIYKSLKKLNINSPDYFQYSQLYNRHVAYMLAVDKAEDLLADYFKKYGDYMLNGGEVEKLGLVLLMKEMQNVAKLYESHRLYVYQSCMYIFHRLFVEVDDNMHQEGESIEDIFDKVQRIFESYHLDSIYYHINLVFEFLKLEYYNHYKVYRQAEKYYEEVNDACANLMVNYATFTFPAQFLLSKLERHLRTGTEAELYSENESIFLDYEVDTMDVPKHIVYIVYRALSSYYIGKFEEAAKLINGLLNDVSLKKYPYAQLEIKSLLALQYTLMHDVELFNQLSNSIQRQIRLFGKDSCENIQLFLKILKITTSEAKKEKAKKINAVIPRLSAINVGYFAPTKLIKLDERFVNLLTEF
ncbi:hypothetical protein KK062_19115 [Fulvivirgaceae bacterium PWU5]|jgi:hypothetical protein|uniref:Uncharacterized protein n=1 Tax=Dawidia cretensis TaxID=2782350 RepID=A0AAP2GR44_9BACT|nr:MULTISPECIES: hypothetical protein [Cytophagales]MBT1710366.1 hypothetical protein [Dawidia cretensis]MCD9015560.1 hypothetical protein [Parachryseolinea silvisoli]